MFILLVNGVPSVILGKKSEFPPRRGSEAWQIVDRKGRIVASYRPVLH